MTTLKDFYKKQNILCTEGSTNTANIDEQQDCDNTATSAPAMGSYTAPLSVKVVTIQPNLTRSRPKIFKITKATF